jgi:hypothetical protein
LIFALSCDGAPSPRPGAAGGVAGSPSTTSSSSSSTTSSFTSTSLGSTTSSTSSTSTGGGPPTWLERPDLWEPVGGELEKACDIHQAKLPAEGLPTRPWTSCGEGCLEAPAVLPDSGLKEVKWTVLEGFTYDGGLHYFVASRSGTSKSGYGLVEIVRLDTDKPSILLRHPPACLARAGQTSPSFLMILNFMNGSDVASTGRSYLPSSTVVFGKEGFDIQSGVAFPFEIGDTWGVIRDWSSVQIAKSAASGVLETVHLAKYAEVRSHRDDMVAWTEWGDWSMQNRARLVLYKQSLGKAYTWIKGEGDIVRSVLNPDRVVWLERKALSDVVDGSLSQVFYAPFTLDPAQIKRTAGPMLPHTERPTNGLVAWGDMVATVVGSESGSGVVVANLVTQKVWFIPNRPDKVFITPMGMDASSLLVAEYDFVNVAKGTADHLLRFDLTKLDALVAAAATP